MDAALEGPLLILFRTLLGDRPSRFATSSIRMYSFSILTLYLVVSAASQFGFNLASVRLRSDAPKFCSRLSKNKYRDRSRCGFSFEGRVDKSPCPLRGEIDCTAIYSSDRTKTFKMKNSDQANAESSASCCFAVESSVDVECRVFTNGKT